MLNEAEYRYCKALADSTAQTSQISLSQKNTGNGLLMTGIKWCLAINQEFVLLLVTIEENLIRSFKWNQERNVFQFSS